MTIEVIVLPEGASDEDVRRLVASGAAVWREDWQSLFVADPGSDEPREIDPDEHEDYVELGVLRGRPEMPDEEDVDGDGFLEGWVGRLGDLYFQKHKDPFHWELLGQLSSDEEAIEMACGVEFDFEGY